MCPAAAAPLFEVDVAIVGGGMVGASLAAALVVSRRIFEGLAVWDGIVPEAAAIRTIHVSEAGRFGFARLRAAEQGIEAFGYVVANRCIGAALWQRLRAAPALTLQAPARVEDLAVSAAGARFTVIGGSGDTVS